MADLPDLTRAIFLAIAPIASVSARRVIRALTREIQRDRKESHFTDREHRSCIRENPGDISAHHLDIQGILVAAQAIRADTEEHQAANPETPVNIQEMHPDSREIRVDSQEINSDTPEIRSDSQEIAPNGREIDSNTPEITPNCREMTTAPQEIAADSREITFARPETPGKTIEIVANQQLTGVCDSFSP